MRTRISLFCLVALLPGLLPAQQTITVTPQSLSGWTITGVDPQLLVSQSTLILPAGAQLARTFVGPDLSLQVTTRPIVSVNAEEWPVLEIGSTALVFARNGSAGRLLLVVGDNLPLELPFDFALDANDRSTNSLAIGLTRQGSAITISFLGQTQQIPTNSASDASLEVVASAGSTQPWAFDQMAVTLGAVTPVSTTTPATTSVSSVSLSSLPSTGHVPVISPAKGGTSGPVAVVTSAGLSRAAALAGARTSSTAASTSTPASTLEVFTPPSVRRSHVAAVRAAAAAVIKSP